MSPSTVVAPTGRVDPFVLGNVGLVGGVRGAAETAATEPGTLDVVAAALVVVGAGAVVAEAAVVVGAAVVVVPRLGCRWQYHACAGVAATKVTPSAPMATRTDGIQRRIVITVPSRITRSGKLVVSGSHP